LHTLSTLSRKFFCSSDTSKFIFDRLDHDMIYTKPILIDMTLVSTLLQFGSLAHDALRDLRAVQREIHQ
ncbi:MAG: hypothetical protein KGH95_07540, partial [Thaumarchaeota archaeon]|nr:hypothetical protein [Nitrososphaerota archaeon]